MKKVLKSTLNSAQEAGLKRYASFGLGTVVLAGAVTTMDASVAYTNYNNLVLNDTITTDTAQTIYGFDVNNDGSQDFRFFVRNEGTTSTGNDALIVGGVVGTQIKPVNVVGVTVGNFTYPSRLGAGVSISAASPTVSLGLTASSYYLKAGTFAFGNGFTNSKWKTAGANSGYLGFSFSAADGIHFGFAQLTVAPQGNGALSRAITLASIAYQTTPGVAITTAVPEPSSIALMAAGGAGILAYRNRRKKSAATMAV